MNKRIKKKIEKRKNTKRLEEILSKISKYFKVDKKSFGDGYFIFSIGINAVCHFTLKEIPYWKFGIWLKEKNGFHIFGEHVELIDKFKPSATYLSYEDNLEDFIEILKKIKENPKLYFVDSLTFGNALIDFKKEKIENDVYYYGYQVVRELNKETNLFDIVKRDESITQESYVEKEYKRYYEQKRKELEDEEFDRKYAFDFFKSLLDVDDRIIGVGIYDGNKGNFRCSPRYTIRVVLKSSISDKEHDKIFDMLNDLTFEKSFSKERRTFEHQFDFYGTFDSLKDIRNSDYKYIRQ